MNSRFANSTKSEKIVMITHLVSSICVVVFALIYIFARWEPAKNIYFPLMGVVMVCQSYLYRKSSKGLAIASLIIALFVFTVFLIGMFFK